MKWKNISQATSLFFITGTINKWQPLFNFDPPRKILLDDFNFYRAKYDARIYAYVVMPDHYHLVLDLNLADELHDWLRDFHSHSANEISKWLKGMLNQQSLSPESLTEHRNYLANARGGFTIWKEQARAVGIYSRNILKRKIEYIHSNPIRKGLVRTLEDWPWCSWRNLYMEDDSTFQVDRINEYL